MNEFVLPLCDESEAIVGWEAAVLMGIPMGISLEDSPTIGDT